MSRSAFRPAVRTLASKRSGCWRMTLRAWVPMEPVEPRIAIFFFIVCSDGGGVVGVPGGGGSGGVCVVALPVYTSPSGRARVIVRCVRE